MNQEELIRLAVLAGCDFAPKLKGVGICKAFTAVKNTATLDEALGFLRSELKSDDFKEAVLLMTPEPVTESKSAELQDILKQAWSKRYELERGFEYIQNIQKWQPEMPEIYSTSLKRIRNC